MAIYQIQENGESWDIIQTNSAPLNTKKNQAYGFLRNVKQKIDHSESLTADQIKTIRGSVEDVRDRCKIKKGYSWGRHFPFTKARRIEKCSKRILNALDKMPFTPEDPYNFFKVPQSTFDFIQKLTGSQNIVTGWTYYDIPNQVFKQNYDRKVINLIRIPLEVKLDTQEVRFKKPDEYTQTFADNPDYVNDHSDTIMQMLKSGLIV